MSSASVVKSFDVVKDRSLSIEFRLKDLGIRQHLCLDSRKAGFCECVVIAIAFGTHILLDPLPKSFSYMVAGILAAMVRGKETSFLY